jgi:N-acetylmuramoyl-L-alanine amidase
MALLSGPTARAGLAGAAAIAVAAALLSAPPESAAGGVLAGRAIDPARFEAGSCVAFAPAAGAPRRETVFIDAGHGGPDPGAVGATLTGKPIHEATETLRVALDAMVLLRARGYRVVLSRTTAAAVARPAAGDLSGGVFTGQGVHRDLIARDACANLARAAILIGVYLNASDESSAGGSLTLYDGDRPFWRSNRRLAQLVQQSVLASLKGSGLAVADDGVHPDVGYGSSVTSADQAYGHLLILGPAKAGYFSAPSRMPGALIEPLFITNPAQASLADGAAGEQAIARGLAAAVGRYFGAS